MLAQVDLEGTEDSVIFSEEGLWGDGRGRLTQGVLRKC